MALRCKRCGGPATAGEIPWEKGRGWCLACGSAASLEIPATKERRGPAPVDMVQGPAWEMTRGAGTGGELWLHQAEALGALSRGENIVVATSTASGKSLVFQAWALHGISSSSDPTTLVFYPTKALANDQERRWLEACELVGLPRETVGKINGDVGMNQRDPIISRARVVIMTPDVCHAWMTRRADNQAVRDFLARLRNVIIDEAHVYEDVFGSNAAYLFRRLSIAAVNAGNLSPPQFVAATATIRSPEEHMRKLTGQEFAVVDESRNGSPRHPRQLLHVPLLIGQGTAEEQLAALVGAIIENDPDAQVIAFHDSRQGIERVARLIDRPDVLPYRSGYNPEDRRRIEEKLQKNQIRAVIATSALELGIDMPDLNYGVNLYLPQSRKQLLQRIGRVGRSRPGTFVILAPDDQFSQHGESMQTYYQEAVEPSNLYLDNEYIAFQQALCMVSEMKSQNTDAMSPPSQCTWPSGFSEALRNAHGRAPRHLDDMLQRSAQTEPHFAYGLRNSGEEKLAIHEVEPDSRARGRKIEEIEVSVAMREAYPGAVYHHQGRSYTVRRWGRDRETRAPYINMVPAKGLDKARQPSRDHHRRGTGACGGQTQEREAVWRDSPGETCGNRVSGGLSGPQGSAPALPPAPGLGPQPFQEAVGLPVVGDPHPDQAAMVRRGLRRGLGGKTPSGRCPEGPLGLPEVGGAGRHQHRGGQRVRTDSQGASALVQLGAGLRQRLRRAGTDGGAVVELGGVLATAAPRR